jgi:NTP pyrophosphatase (non-canonical NTP hydrolase)
MNFKDIYNDGHGFRDTWTRTKKVIKQEQSMTIKALTFEDLRFANTQRNKEWDPEGKIPALFRSTELAGEVGEVCNKVKKLEREALGLPGSKTTFYELASEIADAQITLDLLAMHYGIDIPTIIKLVFNATSEKHGFRTKLGEIAPLDDLGDIDL